MLRYHTSYGSLKIIVPHSERTLAEELIIFIQSINKSPSEIYVMGGSGVYSLSSEESRELHPYARVIQSLNTRQRIECLDNFNDDLTKYYIFLGPFNYSSGIPSSSKPTYVYLMLFEDFLHYGIPFMDINYPVVNNTRVISDIFA